MVAVFCSDLSSSPGLFTYPNSPSRPPPRAARARYIAAFLYTTMALPTWLTESVDRFAAHPLLQRVSQNVDEIADNQLSQKKTEGRRLIESLLMGSWRTDRSVAAWNELNEMRRDEDFVVFCARLATDDADGLFTLPVGKDRFALSVMKYCLIILGHEQVILT